MIKINNNLEKIRNKIFKKFCQIPELLRCKYESFDNFIEVQIPELVKSFDGFVLLKDIYEKGEVTYVVNFGKIKWEKGSKKCRINEIDYCRLTNQTFYNQLYIQMQICKNDNGVITKNVKKYVKICNIPMMVGSKSVNYLKATGDSFGGYFIIDGAQRVIMNLEEIAPLAQYTTVDSITKKVSSIVYTYKDGYKYMNKLYLKSNTITYSFHPIRTELDVFHLLCVLGVTQKEITQIVSKADSLISLYLLKYLQNTRVESEKNSKKCLIRVLYGDVQQEMDEKFNSLINNYLLIHLNNFHWYSALFP